MNSCLLPFDLLSESPLTDIKGEAQDSKSTEIEKVREICAKWRQQPSWPEHAVPEQLKLDGMCVLFSMDQLIIEAIRQFYPQRVLSEENVEELHASAKNDLIKESPL